MTGSVRSRIAARSTAAGVGEHPEVRGRARLHPGAPCRHRNRLSHHPGGTLLGVPTPHTVDQVDHPHDHLQRHPPGQRIGVDPFQHGGENLVVSVPIAGVTLSCAATSSIAVTERQPGILKPPVQDGVEPARLDQRPPVGVEPAHQLGVRRPHRPVTPCCHLFHGGHHPRRRSPNVARPSHQTRTSYAPQPTAAVCGWVVQLVNGAGNFW